MAGNYSDLTPGTAIVWTNTGGTFAMLMKNMANGVTREGAKSGSLVDGTKGMPEILEVTAETKLQTAPTAGNLFDVYLGFSSSATAGVDNPGGLTGTDAALGNADQFKQLVLCGSIFMSGSTGIGTGVQRQVFLVRPLKEYVVPAAQNNTGQLTTNVDGETKITIRPWYRRTPIA